MFYNESESKEKKDQFNYISKLLKARSIIISGEIDQKLSKEVMTQLLVLSEDSEDDIKLYINSQGGHVESGDTIHDMIKFIKPRVKIIGTGWVASAGVLIYLAVPQDDRFSLPNTRFLIHQPAGSVGGTATDMEIEAREIVKMRERINRIISEQTNQPYEKIEEDSDRNYWLSAKEAIEYGIVGKIISSIDEV